jgi:O-antigen ligase
LAALLILIAVFALDKLIYIIAFTVPLSLPLSEFMPALDVNLSLPTEPLLFGIMIIFFAKLFYEESFDRKILTHPISIIIYLQLIWMLVTSFTSTMPIVSFKFLVSRLWFLTTFYFLFIYLFRNPGKFRSIIWAYSAALLIVIAYTLNRHAGYGFFDQEAANFVVHPLYNDHTAYGAALAMIFCVFISFLFLKEYSIRIRLIALAVLVVLAFAIIFSYTRATWVSMAIGLAFALIMAFKIKFKYIAVFIILLASVLALSWTSIVMELEKNRQDSSSDFAQQLQSISNISTDASNLERLNRWNSALRMFEEKPMFGWGPGTYMFQYAPFQMSYEKTIISTNAGDRGNAHSEYLGPMAESGFPAMILMLALVITTLYYAVKLYHRKLKKEIKILLLGCLIGLITYYIHGILNNFLDTDKLSILFWGFTAFVVAVDLYHSEEVNS